MSKGNFISGAWVQGSGESFTSTNPANNEALWQGHASTAADINAAVRAAREAFASWSASPVAARMGVIERFRTEIEASRDELAELISKEMGKALWDSKAEVSAVIGKVAISLEAYRERTGLKAQEKDGVRTVLRHKPHGIMAVYAPYNFPAHLPNGHIVPALIAGNVVILKPSELTPKVGEFMIECWERAGAPKGVVQLVQGAKDTGVALAAHPDINGILFTGSVATGTALHKQFAGRLDVILALELGGNNPLIVTDVDNVDAAVVLMLQSTFITSGQRCTCARRVIIEEGVKGDAILETYSMAARRLIIGSYSSSPEPFMGPLVNAVTAKHAIDAQKKLIAMGAKPILEMQHTGATEAFVTPGIVDVTGVTGIADEEIFAPLVKVYRSKNIEDAMRIANDTSYGLAAGICTDSLEHIQYFLAHVHAGVVSVNRPTTGASSTLPFGGVGVSGNHRPSAYYAADYSAWPVASQETDKPVMPSVLLPGMHL